MQPSVTPFAFRDHSVRVVLIDGEPWFVASDIAEVLGYRDAANAARSLPARQKGSTRIVSSTLGGNPNVTIVSEGGMYRLVLRSRKPEAEAFTDWVTDEVLPTIRKTGAYASPAAGTVLDDHTLYTVWFICRHFSELMRIYKESKLYALLTGLGSRIGIDMHDHFMDGMSGVYRLEQKLAPDFERVVAKFSPGSAITKATSDPTVPDTHILVDKTWLQDLKWGVVMLRRMRELVDRMADRSLPTSQLSACLSHLGGHFIDGTRMILSDAGMKDDADTVADAFNGGGFLQPY